MAARSWISNKGVFQPGDPFRVQVETGKVGHLLVLQLDPSGKVHVLFPLEPGEDAFVQANRRYELRQPAEGASFIAADGGVGLVYAALADDPFRLDPLVMAEGAWSAGALAISRESQDPEAELTALVQRVVSDRGFDYDIVDYQVAGRIAGQVSVPAWWSPAYGEVDDCMGCGIWTDGLYVNVGFGFGWGWPYYYNPWYYGNGYYPGYYPPYYPGYYPPYYPGYPGYYPGYYPSGYIKGRPRGYTVQPYGGQARPHDPAGNAARVSREHLELLSLGPRSCLERMQREVPGICGYALPAFGAHRLAVVTVEDGFDVSAVAERLWEVPIVRGFVFVNEDVIGGSGEELWWALLHRAGNADRFQFSGQRHPVYQTERFFIDATVRNLSAWENRRVEIFGGRSA